MKDEIKEILEFDFQSQGERIEINEYERDILKDYITNLEQENERLKKEQLNLKDELASMWECKARNKEAIEYIKSFGNDVDRKNYSLYFNEIINKVLNILTGGDE